MIHNEVVTHARRPEGMASTRVSQNGNRSHSCVALRDIAAGEEVGTGCPAGCNF